MHGALGAALGHRTRRKSRYGPAIGYDNKFELGERIVDDPLEPGRRMPAAVNVRESAIEHMASRGRLNTAQTEAGARFRRLWEQAAIGRSGAVDFRKEAVDGGGFADPLSDELVRASRELGEAMRAIGPIGCSILIAVVAEGKKIEDVAASWSRAGGIVSGRRAEGYVTGTMVDAINELVRHWRLEGKAKLKIVPAHYKRAGQEIQVSDDIRSETGLSITGPSRQISVGRFGDAVVEEMRPIDRGPMTVHTSGNASQLVRRRRSKRKG